MSGTAPVNSFLVNFPSHQSIRFMFSVTVSYQLPLPKETISASLDQDTSIVHPISLGSSQTPRLGKALLPPWCQDDGHLEAWRNGREVPEVQLEEW